jgi:hypothetical protein
LNDKPSSISCDGTTAFITNSNPNKDIRVTISVDTIVDYVTGQASFKRTFDVLVPRSSTSAGKDIGFRHSKVLFNGDSTCKEVRVFYKSEACFVDSTICKVNLPNNSDLPSASPEQFCEKVDWTKLNNDQRTAYNALYQNLINSETKKVKEISNLASIIFPWSSADPRRNYFDNARFESVGNDSQILPMLPIPIKFLNTDQTVQKFWVTLPNFLSAKIVRSTKKIQLEFDPKMPDHITIQMQLEPSMVIRTDILQHITLSHETHTIYFSGDFLCFSITNPNW